MNTAKFCFFLFFSSVIFQSALPIQAKDARQLLPIDSEVAGWFSSDKPVFYPSDDMWKHINGAQDQYLKYDCLGLTVAYYKDKAGQNEVSIEIYSMPDENCAFGIITEQKPKEGLKLVQYGAFAFAEEDFLHFYKGAYFVKIQLFAARDLQNSPLQLFAKKIEGKIEGKSKIPSIFNVFPRTDRVENSFFFTRKGIAGISSLTNGFGALYKREQEETSIVFLKLSDVRDSLDFDGVLSKMTRKTVGDNKKIEKSGFAGLSFEDKYKGPLMVLKTNSHLFIITGPFQEDRVFSVLEKLNEGLVSSNQ